MLLVMLLAALLTLTAQAAPRLNKKKAKLSIGQSVQLKVKGISKKVKWSSGNKTVAKVKKGLVTAKKAGTAVITAKVGKKKLTCRVTVKAPALAVSAKKVVLSPGRKKTITVTLGDYGHFYVVNDNSLVCREKTGDWKGLSFPLKITALAKGTAKITLTTDLDKTKIVIPVTVQ